MGSTHVSGSTVEADEVVGKSDSEEYPRVYRVNSAARRVLNGFGIVLVSLAVITAVLHIMGIMKAPLAIGDVLADILLVAFAVWISSSVNRRVILCENAIAVEGWFGHRKLLREQIRGYRMGRLAWQAGGGSYYIVVPVDNHSGELKLPALLDYDRPFHAWMKTIPHIEAR
jgi:hypothetical protein